MTTSFSFVLGSSPNQTRLTTPPRFTNTWVGVPLMSRSDKVACRISSTLTPSPGDGIAGEKV
ncbi:MAG TPA: hypothetical protein VFR24_06115 [Candidatus Angelobacter sp.]|nr:hypothetical protein [Candidatus Angelobacter sp.]